MSSNITKNILKKKIIKENGKPIDDKWKTKHYNLRKKNFRNATII